jgi:hypothetical protein
MQDIERPLVLRALVVWPRRGDRIEGVGDRDDAGTERDLLIRDARGVAAAVEALVMVEHNRRQPWVTQRLHQFGAILDMSPHDGLLGLRQGSVLLQDLGRGVELADIVQERRRLNQRDLSSAVLHPPGRPGSVPSHPARVPVQIRIALVHRDGELVEELGAVLDAAGRP